MLDSLPAEAGLDGETRKMIMKMQSTAPKRRVEELAFLRRTDPKGRAMEPYLVYFR
jgi:hypothetical protein